MSHDCGDAQKNLYAYIDAELDESVASSIRAHLEDCPPCLHSFDFEQRLKQLVGRCLREEMPESLLAKVRELIRHETA